MIKYMLRRRHPAFIRTTVIAMLMQDDLQEVRGLLAETETLLLLKPFLVQEMLALAAAPAHDVAACLASMRQGQPQLVEARPLGKPGQRHQ